MNDEPQETGLPAIEAAFAEQFHPSWGFRLPEANVATRTRGEILARGWSIQFLFGRDERGEYFDFLACHRMTDDRHVRIRADGSIERLPMITWRIASADPEKDMALDAAHVAEMQKVAKELAGKGFGLTINAMLRAGLA